MVYKSLQPKQAILQLLGNLPRTSGPRTDGSRTVGPQGPTVRGPKCQEPYYTPLQNLKSPVCILHRPQKQCNVSETSTIIIIKTIQIYHSVTAMCVISVPSTGKIDITSGDFEDTTFQHIGYPDFVTVENAVQMPLGRGKITSNHLTERR